ncbi:MAG: RNA methyltransferase [Chitinophagales bacterium]
MKKISNADLGRISIDEFKKTAKTPLIIILDDIRSLNNIGSVFRTSDAFKIKKIYLCGITAKPPHREIQKTALGATETVEWEHRENILDLICELKASKTEVYAVEQVEQSISLENFEPKKSTDTAIIFGNEVMGVSQEAINICDGSIEIPQFGTKHSLNISVSCGLVVWDLFAKLSF